MKSQILALLLVCSQANAATAFLVNCNATTSVTGMFVYVGLYEALGQYFMMTFTTYCPTTIQVY